jgi:phosphoglycolate phosphatase-like HAD superfamily hydrolase
LFTTLGADAEAVESSYARHSGVPRRVLFDRIARDALGRELREDEFDGLSRAFSAANRKTVRDKGTLKPDVISVLEELGARGIATFVSTASSPEEVTDLARHFGVDTKVKEVMGSRDGFAKGEGHVSHVCRSYGLRREDLVGVGDDVSDVNLFREAGIRAFGVVGTRTREELSRAGADVVIETLEEVLAHVG